MLEPVAGPAATRIRGDRREPEHAPKREDELADEQAADLDVSDQCLRFPPSCEQANDSQNRHRPIRGRGQFQQVKPETQEVDREKRDQDSRANLLDGWEREAPCPWPAQSESGRREKD